MNQPTEEECQKFLANPKVNPRTGKTLYKSGNFYKMLIAICKKKTNGKTYTKKDLNLMAKGLIPNYTKMTADELFMELDSKLRSMDTTMEQRFTELTQNIGKLPEKRTVKDKPVEEETQAPKVKKARPVREILKEKHKIKLTLSRKENNPDDIKVKVDADNAKTKGLVNAKNIKRVLDQFFADTVDKNQLLKEVSGDNYVILYSMTNQGIRFHIPTNMDEIDYARMKVKNLPFSVAMTEMNQLDDKINETYAFYYRLTEDNMNTVADYDIFDMSYVNKLGDYEPIKAALQDVNDEINKSVRSL